MSRPPQHDAAHRRVEALGVVVEQVAERRRTARPPTARRRAAAPPRGTAEMSTSTTRSATVVGVVDRPSPRVAMQRVEVEIACWHGDHAQLAGHPTAAARGIGPRPGVRRVVPRQHLERRPRLGDRAGEDGHAVERPAGRQHAAVEIRPLVGLTPTMPLKAAGTRPDPAVSVPSASATAPDATATPRARAAAARDVQRRVDRVAGAVRACACRPDRSRTGPCWSCRPAPRPRRAAVRRRRRTPWPGCRRAGKAGGRSGRRRRRCCPWPRTVTPSSGPPGATSPVSTAISSRR